ncbi:DoxX family protein [Nonomuraea sp. NPDC049421]|uniref:DoxX family protein n=1 Tax=Nonomuraea sp. NPDC049421 TaxID=3155275 RepID=UPI003435DEF2
MTSNRTPSRPAFIVALWSAQILLGGFIVAMATAKLIGLPSSVETFEAIGWGQWFRYLTGLVELAGGIGMVIPRLAAAAAAGLVGVMVGATVTNLMIDRPAMAVLTAALAVSYAVIARLRWAGITALIGSVRR